MQGVIYRDYNIINSSHLRALTRPNLTAALQEGGYSPRQAGRDVEGARLSGCRAQPRTLLAPPPCSRHISGTRVTSPASVFSSPG